MSCDVKRISTYKEIVDSEQQNLYVANISNISEYSIQELTIEAACGMFRLLRVHDLEVRPVLVNYLSPRARGLFAVFGARRRVRFVLVYKTVS
jgi:hypothetical protein